MLVECVSNFEGSYEIDRDEDKTVRAWDDRQVRVLNKRDLAHPVFFFSKDEKNKSYDLFKKEKERPSGYFEIEGKLGRDSRTGKNSADISGGMGLRSPNGVFEGKIQGGMRKEPEGKVQAQGSVEISVKHRF